MNAQNLERLRERYIRRIKNPSKRAYAHAYLAWKLRGESDEAPEHPGIGTMAAQAVRMAVEHEFR